MDNVFTDKKELKKIYKIEREMREHEYDESDTEDLDELSETAKEAIELTYDYMKKTYLPEQCTVLALAQKIFTIALTGEYKYLQKIHEIVNENKTFEAFKGEAGLDLVRYTVRLLEYYYMVYEKNLHPRENWKELSTFVKRVEAIDTLALPKASDPEPEVVSGKEFMKDLYTHLDRNYVGQTILKKKLTTAIYQWKYHDIRPVILIVGPTGSGKNYIIEQIRNYEGLGMPVITYDCSRLTPNGFTGEDVASIWSMAAKVIRRHHVRDMVDGKPVGDKAIIYLDEVDKIINFNHDAKGESVNAMIQQQLLSSIAGTETIENVDTSKVMFIMGGSFARIEDLKKEKVSQPVGFNAPQPKHLAFTETLRSQIAAIGGEKEFIGRVTDIVQITKYNRDELKQIMLDEHIGVFSKVKKRYQKAGIELNIDDSMVEAILDLIVKEDAGARSVGNIINQLVDSHYLYDLIMNDYDIIRIHKGMLEGEPPLFLKGDAYENIAKCS